jgi:simple sugar transport system ATP-binding protein
LADAVSCRNALTRFAGKEERALENTPARLSLAGITKYFGGVRALHDVSFELHTGEILGLVGDNGAGKSTLLKVLTGAHKPDRGEIYFDGTAIKIHDPRHSRELGIEMVYQHLALCRNLDVTSNLFLGREVCRSFFGLFNLLSRRAMDQMTVDTLRGLNIDVHNPREVVNNLSGGQQQAVAIGKAIRFEPRILLLDEPTANLAVKEANKVLDLMLRLKANGISQIFVTHRLQDLFKVTDRILVLRNGERVGCVLTSETTEEELVKLMFIAEAKRAG